MPVSTFTTSNIDEQRLRHVVHLLPDKGWRIHSLPPRFLQDHTREVVEVLNHSWMLRPAIESCLQGLAIILNRTLRGTCGQNVPMLREVLPEVSKYTGPLVVEVDDHRFHTTIWRAENHSVVCIRAYTPGICSVAQPYHTTHRIDLMMRKSLSRTVANFYESTPETPPVIMCRDRRLYVLVQPRVPCNGERSSLVPCLRARLHYT